MIGVAHDSVEINDAIESPASPDPFVYRLARCFFCFRVIAGNVYAFPRCNRGANELEAPNVCARNQLPVRVSDILNAAHLVWIGKILTVHFCTGKTDIIESLQQNSINEAIRIE